MNIIIFAHPSFMNSTSMPLFAKMLKEGMQERGHTVEVWQPEAYFFNLNISPKLKKWQGYLDQYLRFPQLFKKKISQQPADTLYVFSDQALGPWVPYLADKPHIIHCHDFLALRSSLGLIAENPTRRSGQIYQKYIRRGFKYGKNFISISNRTRQDLHEYGQVKAAQSDVVFNGVNYPYQPIEPVKALQILQQGQLPDASNGMLLHIGGGQWYKNRQGVVELYTAYAATTEFPLPLWLVGPKDDVLVLNAIKKVPANGKVHLLSGLTAEQLNAAYSMAKLFLFPSLAEGFGWPIAEAMASGTLVLTTNEAPMTEVGGDAAVYILRRNKEEAEIWAKAGAIKIKEVLTWPESERKKRIETGLQWVNGNFKASQALDAYEVIYQKTIIQHKD